MKAKPIEVVSGIAKPQAFVNMLIDIGLQIQAQTALPDHDDFSSWQATCPEYKLLCTEKDAVKLWNFQPTAWAVPLVTEIPEELLNTILARIAPKLSSAHGHQTT